MVPGSSHIDVEMWCTWYSPSISPPKKMNGENKRTFAQSQSIIQWAINPHYVDINLIMAIWRNSYSLARIFNKRSCFLWTCLARLLVQKSTVQKKRPCLSTNQIEKVCWLVFSGQRKKYVQQTNTYRKDTRLIWI